MGLFWLLLLLKKSQNAAQKLPICYNNVRLAPNPLLYADLCSSVAIAVVCLFFFFFCNFLSKKKPSPVFLLGVYTICEILNTNNNKDKPAIALKQSHALVQDTGHFTNEQSPQLVDDFVLFKPKIYSEYLN